MPIRTVPVMRTTPVTFDELMLERSTPDPNSPGIGARLAELLYKNGGSPNVGSWGVLEIGGIYGHFGLEQEEALELVHLAGVMRGFGLAVNQTEIDQKIVAWVREEWARKKVGVKLDS